MEYRITVKVSMEQDRRESLCMNIYRSVA